MALSSACSASAAEAAALRNSCEFAGMFPVELFSHWLLKQRAQSFATASTYLVSWVIKFLLLRKTQLKPVSIFYAFQVAVWRYHAVCFSNSFGTAKMTPLTNCSIPGVVFLHFHNQCLTPSGTNCCDKKVVLVFTGVKIYRQFCLMHVFRF